MEMFMLRGESGDPVVVQAFECRLCADTWGRENGMTVLPVEEATAEIERLLAWARQAREEAREALAQAQSVLAATRFIEGR